MLLYQICSPWVNSNYASEEQAVDGLTKLVWQTALIHEAVTLPAWYLNQSSDKMYFQINFIKQSSQVTDCSIRVYQSFWKDLPYTWRN